MADSVATLLTADEFATLYLDVSGYELVRGEVVELMPGGLSHSLVTARAHLLIGTWSDNSGLGRTFTGETGLITGHGPDTVRGADVAYFSYSRLPKGKVSSGFSDVAPELVLEVVGRGQGWDAMVEKAGEYLRMGALRVWVLRPASRSLCVFKNDGPFAELTDDDEVCDESVLPGFVCRVSDFFRE